MVIAVANETSLKYDVNIKMSCRQKTTSKGKNKFIWTKVLFILFIPVWVLTQTGTTRPSPPAGCCCKGSSGSADSAGGAT